MKIERKKKVRREKMSWQFDNCFVIKTFIFCIRNVSVVVHKTVLFSSKKNQTFLTFKEKENEFNILKCKQAFTKVRSHGLNVKAEDSRLRGCGFSHLQAPYTRWMLCWLLHPVKPSFNPKMACYAQSIGSDGKNKNEWLIKTGHWFLFKHYF